MHEVVTVQLGNRANYLATHFWNVQESHFTYPTATDPTPQPSPVDHDINFRPGIGADGSDTYTPRTLIYDFQSNFGGLRKVNALYETLGQDEVVKGLWDGIQQPHAVPPVQPIPYQVNLESGLPTPQLYSRDIRYWSDFNRLYYHPRSVIQLSQQSASSTLRSLDAWSTGVDLFKEVDNEVDILDRDVRPFVEESDSLSAFQIFAGVDDSWGGFTASYVEALREEYGKKGIWVWAIEDSRRTERAKQYRRLANSARSLSAICQNASAYIRLSSVPPNLPEYVRLEQDSEWSMSALLCAAVESATLPARLRNNERTQTRAMNISHFEDVLNTNGNQNIWTLTAGVRNEDVAAYGTTSNDNGHSTPSSLSATTDPRIRQQPLRPASREASGLDTDPDIEPSHLDIDFTPATPQPLNALPSLATARPPRPVHIFAQITSHRSPSSPSSPFTHHATIQSHHTPLPFPLLTSYPSTLFSTTTTTTNLCLPSLSAALSSTTRTHRDVLTLRDVVVGAAGRAMGLVDPDDREALYDDLSARAGAYVWGEEGGSSADEEDGDGDDW